MPISFCALSVSTAEWDLYSVTSDSDSEDDMPPTAQKCAQMITTPCKHTEKVSQKGGFPPQFDLTMKGVSMDQNIPHIR